MNSLILRSFLFNNTFGIINRTIVFIDLDLTNNFVNLCVNLIVKSLNGNRDESEFHLEK